MKDANPSFDIMSKYPTQKLKLLAGERPRPYKAYINVGKQCGIILALVQAGLRKPHGIDELGATHLT